MPKEEDMEKLLKELLKSDLQDEEKIEKALKDKGLNENAIEIVKAQLKLYASAKEDLPKDIFKTLATLVGEEDAEPNKVEKNKGDAVPKDKDGNEVDLNKTPTDSKVEVAKLHKANEALSERLEKSDKVASEVRKELGEERDKRVTKEFVEKAATDYSNLGKADDIGPVMKEAKDKLSKENFEKLSTMMKSADELIRSGGAFNEIGGRGEDSGAVLVEDKIQKAAEKLASEKKITVEKAYDEVIQRPEMKKLYTEYVNKKEAV